MSGNCLTQPTATLYTSQVVTNFGPNQTTDATILTQLIPTATLFGTVCEETTTTRSDTRTSSLINSQDITSRTAVVATRTATLVSASTVNQGGQVVLVTSFSTMSASSVIIVLKTQTPSTIALATSAPDTTSSSSSHAGPIAGGIVAAVVVLAMLAFLACFFRKRSRRSRDTRALDDFFKDALNPGEVAVAGVAGARSGSNNGRRGTLLRRKSSTLLDLENEKDLSHSNEEDNWAALTRLNDQEKVDGGEAETYRHRSISRQSMGGAAVCRAVSLHSIGPEGAWSNAVGVDGIREGPVMQDLESATAAGYLNNNNSKSNTSLSRPGYDDNRGVGIARHSSYLSSRSTDMLPALSPGLGPPPGSPGSPDSMTLSFAANRSDDALAQRLPASPPASMSRQKYARMAHHLSMSGIYPVQHQQQAGHPGFSPPQRAVSPPSGQGMPERPKSALGVMNITEEQREQSEVQQMQEMNARYHPHQRQDQQKQYVQQQQQQARQPGSPQWMPARQMSSDAARLQSRASFAGYGNIPTYHHQHQSPPLSPQRYGSPPLHYQPSGGSRRPNMKPAFSGEYPPSRYSHLDMINGESDDPQPTAPPSRQRSSSGGMLVRMAAAAAVDSGGLENRDKNRGVQSDSTASSTSTSKKNSLSIRNASPEETSAEEEDDEGEDEEVKIVDKGQKMGKVNVDAAAPASPALPPSQDPLSLPTGSISPAKTVATTTKTITTTTPDATTTEIVAPKATAGETARRSLFWSPQSWLGVMST